jgi:copper chaperone CopZ
MTCQHCVAAVHKALAAVDGVEEVVEVSLDDGSATVRGAADRDALVAAVRDSGYTATPA